jgi:hypothetical protein
VQQGVVPLAPCRDRSGWLDDDASSGIYVLANVAAILGRYAVTGDEWAGFRVKRIGDPWSPARAYLSYCGSVMILQEDGAGWEGYLREDGNWVPACDGALWFTLEEAKHRLALEYDYDLV